MFAGKRKKKRKKKRSGRKKGQSKRNKKTKKKKRNVRIANFVKLGPKTVPQSSTYDRRDAFFFTRLSIIERMSILRNAVGLKNAAVDGWKNANSREERRKKKKKKKEEKREKVNEKKEKEKTHVKLLQKVEANRFQFTSSKLPLPPP